MSNPLALKAELAQRGVLFVYSGALTTEVITSILHLLDSKLKMRNIGVRRKKNIVNIAIECLQNIHYHGFSLDESHNRKVDCLVALIDHVEQLELWFNNLVDAEHAASFLTRLNYLNSLDVDQLHQEYLAILNKGTISDKGGGGLGLIRILRESGGPILFDVEQLPNTTLLQFSLRVPVMVGSQVFTNLKTEQ